jgi:hypothetical protein
MVKEAARKKKADEPFPTDEPSSIKLIKTLLPRVKGKAKSRIDPKKGVNILRPEPYRNIPKPPDTQVTPINQRQVQKSRENQ